MVDGDARRRLEQLHAASFAWSVTCCRGDAAEAEEVLQSAYVKVLDGRARFGGRSSFKTWFFAVVRKTALERWRRRRLRRALLLDRARAEPAAAAPDPLAEAAGGERAARVRAALGRLSRRQRQVLDLVFYQELTVAEAAAVLGISVGSARVHYARGKRSVCETMAAVD
jgi:RNA polymerase sigma-70 factor (ECF subfamily)